LSGAFAVFGGPANATTAQYALAHGLANFIGGSAIILTAIANGLSTMGLRDLAVESGGS